METKIRFVRAFAMAFFALCPLLGSQEPPKTGFLNPTTDRGAVKCEAPQVKRFTVVVHLIELTWADDVKNIHDVKKVQEIKKLAGKLK